MRRTRRKKKRFSSKTKRKRKKKLKKNQSAENVGREPKDAVKTVHGNVWFSKIASSLIDLWLLLIQ